MKDIAWKAIEQSDLWQSHIKPWLTELRGDTLEDMSTAKDVDGPQGFRYWQGYVAALNTVLETPNEMMEAERLTAEMENKDAGRDDRHHAIRGAARRAGLL